MRRYTETVIIVGILILSLIPFIGAAKQNLLPFEGKHVTWYRQDVSTGEIYTVEAQAGTTHVVFADCRKFRVVVGNRIEEAALTMAPLSLDTLTSLCMTLDDERGREQFYQYTTAIESGKKETFELLNATNMGIEGDALISRELNEKRTVEAGLLTLVLAIVWGMMAILIAAVTHHAMKDEPKV